MLELLAADEAAGAAGYPKLEAFLAAASNEQLRDDLARMERDYDPHPRGPPHH